MWTRTALAPAAAILLAAAILATAIDGLWLFRWELIIAMGMFFIAQVFKDGGAIISRATGVSHGNASKTLFWAITAALAMGAVLGGIYVFPRAGKQIVELYEAVSAYMRSHLPPVLYESIKDWDIKVIAAQIAEWEVFIKGKELLKNNPETMGAISHAVAKTIHFAVSLPKDFLHLVLLFVGAYYIMEREDPWRAQDAYAIHPPLERNAWGLSLAVIHDAYRTLKAFVLGQIIVCLCASVYYVAGLWIIGVKSALALGLFAGLISFLPIIGTFLGFISITSATYIQSQDPVMTLLVMALFQTGHFLEAKIMIPKVVGARVGLSPLVALLALLVGMRLGIAGMVASVPVAGMARVAVLHLGPEAKAAGGAYYSYLKSLFTPAP